MTTSTSFTFVGIVVAGALIATLEYRSRSNVVTAGFWFDDDVTFEMPAPARIGGPLTADECERIKRTARAEVDNAFKDFRVRIVDGSDAFYRVGVRQILTLEVRRGRRWSGAAGQSNVFGPLGGYGGVSFYLLASQAVAFAPAESKRAEIVDAIGRGIGRAAVHEFAHQILPNGPMHNTQDEASYEYGSSNRPAQYYGEMHWSVARGALLARLGR